MFPDGTRGTGPGLSDRETMIPDERFLIFTQSLETPHPAFLEALYQSARRENIPVIRRDVQSFLRTFLLQQKPRTILEIGTAVGFSAILMACYAPCPCEITTIECDEGRAAKAAENFEASPFAGRIHLRKGDAKEILPTLTGTYDLVFLDAAKGQYLNFLPLLKDRMREGSVLLSDNILQDGTVLQSRFLVERRDRTIHKRMREYLFRLTHDPELSTVLLPMGDGLAFSVMRTPRDGV